MSQSNPVIGSNKSGLTYRQEDNDGKKALLNHHKGSSAPSYAEAGTLWLDDTATPWALKMYDGADWIVLTNINATSNTAIPFLGAAPIKTPVYAADTGSANAYALAPSPAFGSYEAGQMVLLKPGANNTGSSTLAVSGLSAVTIKQTDGSNLAAGALKTTGLYMLVHNGTNFILLNGGTGGGGLLQSVSSSYTSSTGLYTNIPADDTMPTSSEGVEVLSVSITPKSASSRIILHFSGMATPATAAYATAALYANSGSTAFHAITQYVAAANNIVNLSFSCVHEPGTTSPVVYKLRAGTSINSMRTNSNLAGSGRMLGGAAAWTLVAEEHE